MSKDKIVIVGFGFSGLTTLANFIEKAKRPLEITIFDKHSFDGCGVAYGGDSNVHPLNVQADNMGIFESAPQDFYDWIHNNKTLWDSLYPDLKTSKEDYLPRKLYGLYLKNKLKIFLERAKEKKHHIHFIKEEVMKVGHEGNSLFVESKNGEKCEADFLIIAISTPVTKSFSFETKDLLESKNYIRNIWNPSLESQYEKVNSNHHLLIFGSGLTAVDALLSLKEANYKGKISVVSPTGLFPEVHSNKNFSPVEIAPFTPSKDILFILKEYKTKWDFLKTKGADWRQLIDSLRPYTSYLWHGLNYDSKKKFLKRLLLLWNRHRHRMSTSSFEVIKELKPHLQIKKGVVSNVIKLPDQKFEVVIECPEKREAVLVDSVINCSGPEYRLNERKDSLLSSLFEQKMIAPDALNMGIKIENSATLTCDKSGKIFALGSLLFGEKFETTSVPEIRSEADSIVKTILNDFQ